MSKEINRDRNSEGQPYCFLKFGQKEHLEEFHNNGLLYCNSVQYFANLKCDRGDPYEAVTHITNEEVEIDLLENGEVILNIGKYRMETAKSNGNDRDYEKLFCLYSLDLPKPNSDVKTRCTKTLFTSNSLLGS